VSFCDGIGLLVDGPGSSVVATRSDFMLNNPTGPRDRSPVGQVFVNGGAFLRLWDSDIHGAGEASVGVVVINSRATIANVLVALHNVQVFVIESGLVMSDFIVGHGGTGVYLENAIPREVLLTRGLFQTLSTAGLIVPCDSAIIHQLEQRRRMNDLRLSNVDHPWACGDSPDPPSINVDIGGT
jgi:hypothetical protein